MIRTRINSAKELEIGNKISFTCNGRGRGGHYNVTAMVTKVNRKTVKAIECERSYRPGTRWSISINDDVSVYKENNVIPN